MIPVNELRTGIYYSYFGKMYKLELIQWRNIVIHDDNQRWEPILLTPEILEKCGFVEVLNGDYYSHKMLSEKITLYLPYFNLDYYIGNVQVNYLHQLQNLYFALTGEELNINL